MAPLGWAEHRLLGVEVARAYLMTSSSVSLRAHVTSKARTWASCRAFRDGAAALWPEALSSLACDDEGARAEDLLRPYASCARLVTHRAAMLLEERGGGGHVDGGYVCVCGCFVRSVRLLHGASRSLSCLLGPSCIGNARRLSPHLHSPTSLMERARAAVARGLGLPPAAVDEALVLGLSYACQTDLTLLAPFEEAEEGGMRAHMAWIEGAPYLGWQQQQAGESFFSACAVLPPELLEEMERREDRENYLMRGFGLAASRWVDGCVC